MHSIRLLLIEDNPADVRLTREALVDSTATPLVVEHCPTLDAGLRRLTESGVDCVLLDLELPDSRGLDTFRAIHDAVPHLPVIILSSCDNDDLALRAVQAGAQDYLPKGEVTGPLLVRCVRYALERKKAQRQTMALNSELERRVRERTRELACVNQELEAFSYSVAHDLRRPLRAIDGFSAALGETCGGKLDPQERNYFDRIRGACMHMDHLIDALLTIARLSHLELRHERVDLSEIAEEIVRELRRRDPTRVVQAVVTEGLTVFGDPHLLTAVVENLLANAWKFTRHRTDGLIEFSGLPDGDDRVFYIRDNGVGFDMAYANKLFQPFERLHLESEFEGLGVGLTTVQRIVRRHGGHVWAEGAVDQGATFFFALQKETAHHEFREQDCIAS
ncbi:MAG TPA: ATP-binding protein [Pirellulales bacterium]